jgi:hypothetical protein
MFYLHGTPTYPISLIYRKRHKDYDSDTITLQKYQLFDLEVRGQRQNVVMLVHDTPSHDYTLTCIMMRQCLTYHHYQFDLDL